ncbi:MAG: hypothetical protein ACKO4T_07315 [Planctomycetaceae bacterium]
MVLPGGREPDRTRAGIHRLTYVLAVVLAWPALAEGDSAGHELRLLDDGSVKVTAPDGASASFAPRFVVLRSESDPKLQIRGASPGGVDYNLTTWGKDDQSSESQGVHVPDGSDPTLDQAAGEGRTSDIFHACPNVMLEADAATWVGDDRRRVRWHFQSTASFGLEADLQLPADGTAPMLTYTFSPILPGWYSVGYVGAPDATVDEADEFWQPLIWNEKRLPDQSYLTQAFRCPLPTALLTLRGVTTGVVADPREFPFMPLPTHRQNNPFGVALRTQEGKARAMLFAPVLGGERSRMAAGERFQFSVRLAVINGGADTAFEAIARGLYGFCDRRSNVVASLNTTLERMIAYGLSDWSAFDEDLRGCTYSTDVPGAVKNVSSLHPLGVAMVTDEPIVFERRARPMIEFMLSRDKFLFALDPEIKIQSPSWLLGGPCCPLSELTALYTISGGRCQPLLDLAVHEYGRDRVFNLDVPTRGDRWQNALALFRATEDPAWKERAITMADAYLARRNAQPQTDFSDPDSEGMVFWPSWVPQWIELYELFEATGEQRFLDAATQAARDFAMFTWMCPAVPDASIEVDQSGKAPRYRGGRGYDDIPVTPATVPAWRLSEIGLTPEASATSKGHRGILNAHHAPYMLRIASATGDTFLHDVARNAIVGRYQNFPGYHINTDRSLVFTTPDFPLRPQRQLNATTSIHYNHIWPHIALLIDYLVADVFYRSGGAIDFPSRYAEGYAYLQTKIYGDRPGTIYGEPYAWLWMPRGLLALEDTVELNWVAARGEETIYLIFSNQSDRPQRSHVKVSQVLCDLRGDREARVWRENEQSRPIAVHDGEFEVDVAPRGITALAIDQVRVMPAFQRSLKHNGTPWKTGHATLEFGGLDATILDFGDTQSWMYVFLKATDKVLERVTLRYRTQGQTEFQELSDVTYPFEFRVPLAPAVDSLEFHVEAIRPTGERVRSEAGRLQR